MSSASHAINQAFNPHLQVHSMINGQYNNNLLNSVDQDFIHPNTSMLSLPFDPQKLLIAFIIIVLIGLILTILLTIWIIWRVRRIRLPEGADFFTALEYTPLSIVILLDLLDLVFDFLSAPISWTILSYLGLQPLRGVTVVESLIPGTQFLPTMTIFWMITRLLRNRIMPYS